jgi:HK97 family phage prohead protease
VYFFGAGNTLFLQALERIREESLRGGHEDVHAAARGILKEVEMRATTPPRPLSPSVESRELPRSAAQMRVVSNGSTPKITGYASVFRSRSVDLGGFVEEVHPDAFRAVLARKPDVRGLVNHDPFLILGRTASGTLELQADPIGLRFTIYPPDSMLAASYIESVRRGDLSGASFTFTTGEDRWDSSMKPPLRTVLEVRELFDISLVSYPAYPATEVSVRHDGRTIDRPDVMRLRLESLERRWGRPRPSWRDMERRLRLAETYGR